MPDVLIIGDTAADLGRLACALAVEGIDATIAVSAAQACALAKTEMPHAIIVSGTAESSVEMCRVLGLETAMRRLPWLVFATVAGAETELEILRIGACDVIDPQATPATIAAKVRAHARIHAEARVLAELSDRLDAARKEAQLVAVSRSDFLASMSHEIRTPLTSILGYADLLLDPNASARNRMVWIQTIRTSGEHLVSIVNDVRDMA
jgi:signal transduction histidine kinase